MISKCLLISMAVSKFYPTPFVKYLNFATTKAIVNIFYWNFACRQSSNRYETYKTELEFEGLGSSSLGGLRGCGWGQNLTFSEYGHVAYQIKADGAGSNMVANILPTDTALTQGVGSKGQTICFSEK